MGLLRLNRVTYWHVHDIDAATPEDALREIEQRVHDLVAELKRSTAAPETNR